MFITHMFDRHIEGVIKLQPQLMIFLLTSFQSCLRDSIDSIKPHCLVINRGHSIRSTRHQRRHDIMQNGAIATLRHRFLIDC
ncbi:MAG: hypothetical protein ACJAZA_001913 [Shewanella psychromarinicola]|jgi:hypothetical protein